MDEPTLHIIENIPARELPERVRGKIDPSHHARVTVEDLGPPAERTESFAELWRRIPVRGEISVEDAAKRIRSLRDEWDM
jgi:hypothetical protein